MNNEKNHPAQAGQVERRVMHWFCFSYYGQCNETGRQATASAYVGYPGREVTAPMIDKNKKVAGVTGDSALIAVSYLGEMTREEFLGHNAELTGPQQLDQDYEN
ncbi:hypothetical protein [Methylomonas sp. CM2]|uniref:hypothetical protein n=1 Tax=Methylomonas sp. CM2 TaxID=3417647 RepID=UPI003CFB778B